jgi:hypothetical protein
MAREGTTGIKSGCRPKSSDWSAPVQLSQGAEAGDPSFDERRFLVQLTVLPQPYTPMKNIRILVAFALLGLAATALRAADEKKDVPADKPAKCCAKAATDGKACTHECCVEAAKAGNNCEKCGGHGKAEKHAEHAK